MQIAETIKIIYEDEALIIFDKPSFLPTVPLKKSLNEDTLLSFAIKERPELDLVDGLKPWEKGVIHRLDTPTSGLVMIAKTNSSYLYYFNEQKNGRIEKKYRAKIDNKRVINDSFIPFPYSLDNPLIESYFRYYGKGRKEVRPTLDLKKSEGKKVYQTRILELKDGEVLAGLKLGFKHQVRAHLAWMGFPIIGDTLYLGKESSEFGLRAIGITFTEFKTKKKVELQID